MFAKDYFLPIALPNADEIVCAFEVKFGEELFKGQGEWTQGIKILESDVFEPLVIYA